MGLELTVLGLPRGMSPVLGGPVGVELLILLDILVLGGPMSLELSVPGIS